MTNSGLSFKSSDPQLFVFTQAFTFSKSDECQTYLNDFEKNYDKYHCMYWTSYWKEHGENLILENWNVKYASNLANKVETLNITDDTDVTKILKNRICGNGEIIDDSSDIIEREEEDYRDVWAGLWKEHSEDIYNEQYLLYSSVFYEFYVYLKKYFTISTTQKEVNELITHKNSVQYEEQLRKLGLPTSFSSRSQQAAIEPNLDQINSIEELIRPQLCSSEHIGDYEEFLNSEMSSDSANDVTETPNNKKAIVSKKKKKNRRLRKIPQFILEEKGLLKYWLKRFSLFSRFDEGIRLDREGWFSVTPEKIGKHQAKVLACDVIVDGFCGCGGNAIQFAKTCKKVIAIDIDPMKLEMAKHNANIYGVANKIEFIQADYLQFCEYSRLQADAVFLSPPWGGPRYKYVDVYNIEEMLEPVSASELVLKSRNISENIAIYLPRNAALQQIIQLAGAGNQCKVEHNFLNKRLVAITAIYGQKVIHRND